MRRFFGLGQPKDKAGKDGIASKSPASDGKGSGDGNTRRSESQSAPSAAATANDDGTAAIRPCPPPVSATGITKQVAFASPPLAGAISWNSPLQDEDEKVDPRSDVHSLVSHHGGVAGGSPCLPRRVAHTSQPAPAATPSLPTRQLPAAAFAHREDATLRPTPASSSRGEIPIFYTHPDSPSAPSPLGDQQQLGLRSTTSLSHNTTDSHASSAFAHPSTSLAFYSNSSGINNNGSAAQAYYPNLAVLATYSRDVGNSTGGNGILHHLTWSEITDDELVENLGGRERTRQEVLFEMVCSEERYVQELKALRDNYLEPLLRRNAQASTSLPVAREAPYNQPAALTSTDSIPSRRPLQSITNRSRFERIATPNEDRYENRQATPYATVGSQVSPSSDRLPIAAMFARRESNEFSLASRKAQVQSNVPSTSTTRSNTSPASSEAGAAHDFWRNRDASGGTTASAMTQNTSAESEGDDNNTSGTAYNTISSSRKDLGLGLEAIPLQSDPGNHLPHENFANIASADQPSSPRIVPKPFKHHLKALIPPPPNKLHKPSIVGLHKSLPLVLPEDLRIVCETTISSLLEGHETLSRKLRARYEEQYPLVRSLADVFTDQAWMVEHYATYVLHLERALADIDDTLAMVNPLISVKSKPKDKEVLRERKQLAKEIMHLEEQASMRAHTTFAIGISQPFQRLLKYPLLFQSLLYHTDPSTRDYEATQKLALEIDAIVRSIENQKASEEERARTRDCWARIEGVNDKALLNPRSDRLLVSETAMWSTVSPAMAAARRTFSDAGRDKTVAEAVQDTSASKKTIRRLSDLVGGAKDGANAKQPSIGSKRDVWLVAFTDVVLRCHRVGVTKLPMGSSSSSSYRHVTLLHKDRNLYRFLKVDHWIMHDHSSLGVVRMEDVALSRMQNRIEEDPFSESEAEAEDLRIAQASHTHDGEASRMSFTYTREDARPVFDVDPLIGIRPPPPSTPTKARVAVRAAQPISPKTQQVAKRTANADAKFGNRVRPSNVETPSPKSAMMPSAKTRAATPSGRTPSRAADRERGGFSKPTAASIARSTAAGGLNSAGKRLDVTPLPDSKRIRAISGSSTNASPLVISGSTSFGEPSQRRNSTSSIMPVAAKRSQPLRTKHSSEQLGHRRQGSDMDSGVALFNRYWRDDEVE